MDTIESLQMFVGRIARSLPLWTKRGSRPIISLI